MYVQRPFWVVQVTLALTPGLLVLYMASNDFVKFVTYGSEGTTMPLCPVGNHVGLFSRQRLRETEQRAISHIFGFLDDKINLNRRMSETLEGIAHSISRSWFVNFDPVRAKVEVRSQSAG